MGGFDFEELKPHMLNVFSCLCHAGYTIVSKVSLNKGMSLYVLLVYGHALGTITTALLAFLYERKNKSKISAPVLRNIFCLGVLGTVFGRTLNYAGLKDTSSTFASAMSNLIPSFTFILAILFRMEKVEISKGSTQAKIWGTLVALVGAVLLTLYKGVLIFSLPNHHSLHQQTISSTFSLDGNWIKGSLMLVISYLSLSALFILQAMTIKMYPAPISLTAWTCFVGTFLGVITATILDRKPSSWRLAWNITLVAPLFNVSSIGLLFWVLVFYMLPNIFRYLLAILGIMIFGIATYVQTWIIQMKGPIFMTAYRPLSTLFVAIMGVFILGDPLYLGGVVGATFIILGLYAILWGKGKEKENKEMEGVNVLCDQSIEIKMER